MLVCCGVHSLHKPARGQTCSNQPACVAGKLRIKTVDWADVDMQPLLSSGWKSRFCAPSCLSAGECSHGNCRVFLYTVMLHFSV